MAVRSTHPNPRVTSVLNILESMLNNARRTGTVDYQVRAYQDIRGKSLDEIRHVVFWVGVAQEGGDVSLGELAGLFCMFTVGLEFDRNAMARRELGFQVYRTPSVILDIDPADEVIRNVLKQLEIEPPHQPASN